VRDSRRLRLVLAVLLLTSVTLLTLDARGGGGGAFGAVRSAVGTVLSPLQRAVRAVTAPVGRAAAAAANSGRDARRIADLERDNAALLRERAADAQASKDLAAIRSLGYFGFRGSFRLLPAKVTARGTVLGEAEQTVTIDVGTADGVQADMKAVDPQGHLVGRIRRVGAHDALVVLLTDRTSSTGVQPANGKVFFSTVTGQGAGLPLTLTDGDLTRGLKTGDPFYTVEATTPGGVFIPGGLPVGTVTRVGSAVGTLAITASVQPYADLGTLDQVGVAVGQTGRPRRAVLPNTPGPP